MKKLVVVLTFIFFGISTQAQKKNAKVSFDVDGICGMCKKRIETAALKTKGVKFASWSVNTHQLNLILDERKTDVNTVKNSIAAVGHDSKGHIASDEAYNSVHPCCKYRDEEIVKDHNGELKKQKKKN